MLPAPVVVCQKKSRGVLSLRGANNIKDCRACIRFGAAGFGVRARRWLD
jgi:hypothetical protein